MTDRVARLGASLEDLRAVVATSRGPSEVVAIANGGDGPSVQAALEAAAPRIFRADGATRIFVHEERSRRGQLLGLLDAQRRLDGRLDRSRVVVGIMLPGRGTRLSPLTQRLHGIKPFLPMLIRRERTDPWLDGATASLFSWTLVGHHLERLGFRGVAWKWGDEPQLPATSLAVLDHDLATFDAIRFGSEVEITESLARSKEWLVRRDGGSELALQLRRRPRADLLERLGASPGASARALVHIGSPALSFRFLDAAEATFGTWPGWLDVDGYLFEALTHDPDAWARETERDPGLGRLVADRPGFYDAARELRLRLEERKGDRLRLGVIDFGSDLYWGDIGQLARARATLGAVARADDEGEVARRLAALDQVPPDDRGNRVVGSRLPSGHRLRNSVVVGSDIVETAEGDGVVVVDSVLGGLTAGPGTVVLEATVGALRAGREGLLFRSVASTIELPDRGVHTTMPRDPLDLDRGLASWWESQEGDPGAADAYDRARPGNPDSHARQFATMRQREVAPDRLEAAIRERFVAPARQRILARS